MDKSVERAMALPADTVLDGMAKRAARMAARIAGVDDDVVAQKEIYRAIISVANGYAADGCSYRIEKLDTYRGGSEVAHDLGNVTEAEARKLYAGYVQERNKGGAFYQLVKAKVLPPQQGRET